MLFKLTTGNQIQVKQSKDLVSTLNMVKKDLTAGYHRQDQ